MYERRNHAKRLLFGGLLLGNFTGLFLALVEVAFLVFWRGGARTQGAPSQVLFYDALVVLAIGPVIGLVLGGLAAVVHLVSVRLAEQRQQEPIWKARCHTVLAMPVAAYLGSQAFQGPWASQLPGAKWLAMVTGGVLLIVAYGASRVLVYRADRLARGHAGPWLRWLAAPLLLLGAIGLYLADQLILPRLYPWFHWALGGLTVLLAWLGAGAIHLTINRQKRRVMGQLARPMAAVVASFVVLVAGLFGHRAVGGSNLLRMMLFERTGLASKSLVITARLGVLPKPKVITPTPPKVKQAAPARRRPQLRGADVVLISVDALRADRLGLFGYHRKVAGKERSITPNIDRIFGKGTRFSRAYCATPRTSYSVVSLLTGQPIYDLARVGEHRLWPTLPEVLQASLRYHTAGFYPLAIFTVDGRRFEQYRTRHLGFEYFKFEDEDLPARKRTDQVITFLDHYRASKRTESVFLWVHYFDPHEPYRVRPGYGGFGSSAADRYDAEIAYVDAEIGRLVEAVKQRRERVLFVLTADHGEEFGEHGGANHGTSVFDEQVRVPLLFAGPGLPDRQVAQPVSLTQVPATVLRLLQHTVPFSMDGTGDLIGLMAGRREDTGGAMSSNGHLRMFALGHHKLIEDTRRDYLALYDLKRDPAERRPLDIDRGGAARKRTSQLLGHLRQQQRRLERIVRRTRRSRREGTPVLALSAPDLERRREAVTTLMRQARLKGLDQGAAQALGRAVRDEDPEVRHRAVIALAAHAARSGKLTKIEELVGVLARPDLPDDMRLAAGLALAAARDPRALAPLIELLPRVTEHDGRVEVVRALGQMEGATPQSVGAMIAVLEIHGAAVSVMRAFRRLSGTPMAAALVAGAVPALYRLLTRRPEHMGQRSEALATLACIGNEQAVSRLAGWLLTEPEQSVRAVGLGLLSRLIADGRGEPGGRLWEVPGPGVRGPPGACSPGRGCRLETAPVEVTVPLRPDLRRGLVTLWVILDEPIQTPPLVHLGNQDLLAGSPFPIAVGQIGRIGGQGEPREECRRLIGLPKQAWRYVVPRGLLDTGELALQLRDLAGSGAVVRTLALLPVTTEEKAE